MSNKRILPILTILIILVLPLLTYAFYVQAQVPCKDNIWPIPSPALVQFGSYNLITDQGPLYVGQTYEHRNEGPWVGNMRLLFIDTDSATLLFQYPQGNGTEFTVLSCRGYMPREHS